MSRMFSRIYSTRSPNTAKSPNGLFAIVARMASPSSETILVQMPSLLVTTLTKEPGARRSAQQKSLRFQVAQVRRLLLDAGAPQ